MPVASTVLPFSTWMPEMPGPTLSFSVDNPAAHVKRRAEGQIRAVGRLVDEALKAVVANPVWPRRPVVPTGHGLLRRDRHRQAQSKNSRNDSEDDESHASIPFHVQVQECFHRCSKVF